MTGRLHAPKLVALLKPLAEGKLELLSPGVGLLRDAPLPGQTIRPGSHLGVLEVLGVLHPLEAPAGAAGVVTGEASLTRAAKLPVDYASVVCRLEPQSVSDRAESFTGGAAAGAEPELVFRAPTSGRFYARPTPEQPAFVEAGSELDVAQPGQLGAAVCLLEVMKTFNRIHLAGDGLPPRVRVLRVLPKDGDDVELGQPLLELERIE